MKSKLLIAVILFVNSLFYCQKISKIEFHHSNPIIVSNSIDITVEAIKQSKKDKIKIRVKKGRENEYFLQISKKKIIKIYNACQKIEYDTVALKENLIDGSSTNITLYDNLNNKKDYYAAGLSKKSKDDNFQKDFWYATSLIIKTAGLKMKDLIDYR
ncbi:hypothetical protein ACNFU2_17645 [Chryseobacterium sp. PTM-20240506]|uniref:hypothetical protein n=1 Tax=Chryseobacterium sp. PTM-20240506 TaxID=3400631 RepID=UPI003AAC32FA